MSATIGEILIYRETGYIPPRPAGGGTMALPGMAPGAGPGP